jgi:hypothetical protein
VSGTANSLADAIRRQADAQAMAAKSKGMQAGGAPANPLDQLMQQIQSINVEATPYETLLSQATGAAGSQYNPLIAELQAEMSRTKQRGKANQAQAKQMYGDLATDIASEMPQITQQMAQASQETENRYNQTQQELQGQYNQQAQQQAELYKKLGIQAAGPEASQQAMEDQAYFQQQSQSDEDAALQLLKEMKNADVSYNRESAGNTRLAGVNAAQDIGAQLEEYLQAAGSKMAGLKSGRESAIQGMLAQLQQQDSQRMAQQEESEYDRLMDMFNLQLKMQEMQNKSGGGQLSSLFKGTNGPTGASNYLGEIYGSGDTFTSNSIMEAINDVMADPSVIAGKYQTDQKDQYGQPMQNRVTDAYMQNLLRRRLSEGDLDPNTDTPLGATQFSNADVNHAINTLMAMMGKLK